MENEFKKKISLRSALGFGCAALLAACQAKEIEIKLSTEDLRTAANGEAVQVSFEAAVGERYTTVDDEKREDIEKVTLALEKFLPNADIEVDFSGDGYTIEIEGELTVSNAKPPTGAPYFVSVVGGPLEGSLLITLETSGTYLEFAKEFKAINAMLKPDEFQPVEFKLKGDGDIALVAGGYVDGRPINFKAYDLSSKRTNISFSDGIWKKAAAGFVLLP